MRSVLTNASPSGSVFAFVPGVKPPPPPPEPAAIHPSKAEKGLSQEAQGIACQNIPSQLKR